ncbi:MAG: 3D domain-containing protein, partial [Schwartzia sp.]|nr:3D domain-containing protein [Schwartzia sp. (in: firmicutes)]
VDPSFIPLGTRVYIPGYGEAVAEDTGGAIVGNIIDIAFDTHEEALAFGRQDLEIYILEYPW